MHVLITGGATGIGAATAAALRASGAEITVVDIADPGPATDHWISVDLTDPEAIAQIAFEAEFDALVNAAGLPPRPGLEAGILNLNFLGLRRMTERALPHLRKGASIVNVSSKAGARWRTNIEQVRRFMALSDPSELPTFIEAEGIDPVRAYDLSKEAVILWTKQETQHLQGLGLRANTVSPAAIETRILSDFMTAFGERAEKGVELMGRAGTAEEVASVIAFLSSPASGWVKGVDIPVDGGLDAMLAMRELSG